VFNQAGGLIGAGLVDPLDGSRQTAINPLDLPGAAGCESGGELMGPYDHQLWGSASSRYACAWDYPAAAIIQQPQKNLDFIGRASFAFADNHTAFVEFTGSKVEVRKSFEPNQISSSTSTAATAFGRDSWYPATGASYDRVYNALAGYFGTSGLNYGAPIAYRWRCMECGPRSIQTETDAYRVLAGLEGQIGRWDYTAGVSRVQRVLFHPGQWLPLHGPAAWRARQRPDQPVPAAGRGAEPGRPGRTGSGLRRRGEAVRR